MWMNISLSQRSNHPHTFMGWAGVWYCPSLFLSERMTFRSVERLVDCDESLLNVAVLTAWSFYGPVCHSAIVALNEARCTNPLKSTFIEQWVVRNAGIVCFSDFVICVPSRVQKSSSCLTHNSTHCTARKVRRTFVCVWKKPYSLLSKYHLSSCQSLHGMSMRRDVMRLLLWVENNVNGKMERYGT